MKLGKREIILNQEYRLHRDVEEASVISESALFYDVLVPPLADLVRHETYNVFLRQMISVIGLELGQSTFVYDLEEYSGDMLYRIRKYLELNDIRITAYTKQRLAQNISRYTIHSTNEILAEFSTLIDWDSGEFFEDRTSCWWDERYGGGKMVFLNHIYHHGGGFALKIWGKNGERLGRCFGVLTDREAGDFALFNLYVRPSISPDDILRLIGDFVGYEQRRVTLRFTSDSAVYVNGDSGYHYGKSRNSAFRVQLESYQPPYDPQLEVYRLSKDRFPDQEQCEECNRYYTYCMYFIKPYNKALCSECMNRMNIYTLGPLYQSHVPVYYDREYYKYSKADRNKIVRIAGRKYEPNKG